MNFSTLKSLSIPEGKVTKIQSGGKTLWQEKAEVIAPKFNYVSLGDSIAAGHRIDKNWDYKYSWGRQYKRDEDLPAFPTVNEANAFMEQWIKDNKEDIDAGFITYTTTPHEKWVENPITEEREFEGYCYHYYWHTSTKIAENSYTDLVRKKLQSIYGENNVTATSFAVSGSLVYENSKDPSDPSPRSLYDILDDPMVMNYLPNANLVTISIGANVVLGPALDIIPSFLMNGVDLSATEATIENSLRQLADPNYQYSYIKLFRKLAAKNPNAKYVFSTVYNPVKYMYLDRGTWDKDFKDGFFGNWLNNLPQITVGGWEADREIKKLILDTELLVNIRNRVNGYGNWEGFSEWAKRYLETGGVSADGTPYLGLRQVIINAIDEIKKNPTKYSADINPDNFVYTDTYELFNTVPDRQGAGEVHFNDLVNMQLTRGYDANDLPWDNLWGNEEGSTKEEKQYNYWSKVIKKHTSASGIDFNGIVIDLAPDLINKIISVAFDPHPRTDGHYLYYRSIFDTLGWQPLHTISYSANGGTGTMSPQRVINHSIANNVSRRIYSLTNPNKFSPMAHYHFLNWKSSYNSTYSNRDAIYVTDNITLTAQWAINTNTLTVIQGVSDEVEIAKLFDRDYKNRQLYINGFAKALDDRYHWDAPLKNTQTYEVPYGEIIKMMVSGNVERTFPIGNLKKPNCPIKQYNGTEYVTQTVANIAEAEFYMPDRDVTIEFHFDFAAGVPYSHSYWIGYINDKDLNVTFSGRNS